VEHFYSTPAFALRANAENQNVQRFGSARVFSSANPPAMLNLTRNFAALRIRSSATFCQPKALKLPRKRPPSVNSPVIGHFF
jgi:hypothetical protein